MTTRLAIVIPIFRHSTLAQEAIDCALSLEGDLSPVVIAVDDGCPHAETRLSLHNWSLAEPDRFVALHQVNRGLSGARNTGIAYALEHFPDLEAVYLLDADNRLDDHALPLFEHLLATHPDIDWFYPNFDMFGVSAQAHNGGAFSVGQLAESNPCEAGSLVRRRIFDAGLLFDETMRAGYEDWEFWLQAAGAGFRGMPVRQAFFRYRKRPESMLSGSHGSDSHLRTEIRKRHRWLYDKDTVAQRLAREVPRTVLFDCADDENVVQLTDPRAPAPMTRAAALDSMVAAAIRPDQAPRPMTWCFAKPGVVEHLNDLKLGASALWQLQSVVAGSEVAVLRLRHHHDGQRQTTRLYPAAVPRSATDWARKSKREQAVAKETFAAIKLEEVEALEEADILLIRTEVVLSLTNPANEAHGGDPEKLLQAIKKLSIARVEMELETVPEVRGASPLDALGRTLGALLARRDDKGYLSQLAPWRDAPMISGPGSHQWILTNQSLGALPFPILREDGEQHIGFVLPIFLFGGVEKCVVALASALKRQGVKCHLFIYGTSAMTGTDWLLAPFETVHQITDPVLRAWGGKPYMGTNMATEPDETLLKQMMACLTGMDAVIVSGCAAAYYGFSALRAKGIRTLTWEHLLERGMYGRSYGTPYLAVAYEGAIDTILTCSAQLRDWLHSQGVPSEKLLALPNGPGFPLSVAARAEALEVRRTRAPDAPLRVGFLGRLDQQKGADRFLEIVAACTGMPIEFSITGSAVLGDSGLHIPKHITRYPAAFGIEALNDAFGRIDVLLMPSRDEGLPLTIFEAQRVGVIPVATDVGAVAEAIEDGETGVLIRAENVVGDMVAALAKLCSDPDLRAHLVRRASEGSGRWDANATRLLDALAPAPQSRSATKASTRSAASVSAASAAAKESLT